MAQQDAILESLLEDLKQRMGDGSICLGEETLRALAGRPDGLQRLKDLQANPKKLDLSEHLDLRLKARGFGRLATFLPQRLPDSLGSYTQLQLMDFGAESLLLSAEAPQGPVVIKLPFMEYDQPQRLDLAILRRRRNTLEWEAEVLKRLGDNLFPHLHKQLYAENPLLPRSFPPKLRGAEIFLVMERLEEPQLQLQARRLSQAQRWKELELLLVHFQEGCLRLQEEIQAEFGPTALYTDLKPENCSLHEGRIRFFDAGSVLSPGEGGRLKLSPLYLSPQDFSAAETGQLEASPQLFERTLERCLELLLSEAPILPGEPSPPLKGAPGTIIQRLRARLV